MTDTEMLPEESGQNLALHEAIEALRKGNRARARDLLTRQLKTDQGNILCWIWLSAAVDTAKERLYCLQTALQLDPENAAAKRGLVMLGGMPPDDAVPPFPLDRQRAWEETFTAPVEHKEQKETKVNLGRPILRLVSILAVCVALAGVAYFGFLSPNAFILPLLNRPRYLDITITFTPTGTIYDTPPTPTKPPPLSLSLQYTYTPTPLYVMTPHSIDSQANFNAALHFFEAQDYENARKMFKQVLQEEPEAADAYYYIGESYRLQQDYPDARDAYQSAIRINSSFAPAYLGRALSTHAINLSEDVSPDFDNAILLDPNFIAAYVERGAYRLDHNDPYGALSDEQAAIQMNPASALAYRYLAEGQLQIGENDAALASALRANQLDITMIPVYLVLAQAYIATGSPDQAKDVLQTYNAYTPEDIDAYLTLATVYNAIGDYQSALQAASHYLNENPRNPVALYQSGLAKLNLGTASLAEVDFRLSTALDPTYFDGCLGLAQALFAEAQSGTAYIQANQSCESLAKTDSQRARVIYLEAKLLEDLQKIPAAKETWHRLLMLPASAMPEDWRNEAFSTLKITPTVTPTLRYTYTPTMTATPLP